MIKKQATLFRYLVPYIRKYFFLYALGFVFMILHNYGYLKLTDGFKQTLSYITTENTRETTLYYLGLTFFYLFFTVFFMYAMRYLIIGNSRKIEYDIRKKLFDKLLYLPIAFYKKEETGDLVSRVTNDLNDIRTLLGPGLMYVPNSLSRLGFFIPVMLTISFKLLSILLIQMTILIFLIFLVMPRLKPFYKRVQDIRAQINNQAWQVIFGITTIKLNTMEKYQSKKFENLSEKYVSSNLKLARIEEFAWPFFFFFFSLSEILILLVGGQEIIENKITIPELLQFSIMVGVIAFPIFSLGWVMSIIQQGVTAQERINKFFDFPIPKKLPFKTEMKKPYHLEFKNVSFKNENGEVILNKINFKIKAGEFLGISGKIGTGKTLLIEMIAKVVSPTSGKIVINGIDIQKIPNDIYYQIIALVPQETFLFSTTMKNNLAFEKGDEPIMPEVVLSAKVSNLHDEINDFKDKYNQVIGERGITLSGGQKQRTAIARAIYKKADILIMDDSLSSVDSQTEENIIRNFKKIKNLKTVVYSSHKISFLKQAHRIIFLKDGKIHEQGTHSQLFKKKGEYYKLVELQKLKKSFDRP